MLVLTLETSLQHLIYLMISLVAGTPLLDLDLGMNLEALEALVALAVGVHAGVHLEKSPRGGKSTLEDILGGGVRIVSNIQF